MSELRCQTCEGEIVGGPHCGTSKDCKACANCVCPDCHGCDDRHCQCGLDDSQEDSHDSHDSQEDAEDAEEESSN